MDSAFRGKTLAALVEHAVAIDSLPFDLSLVAGLNGDSMIPISVLTCHRSLLPRRPADVDIISACEQSSILQGRIICCPDPCLVLPFFVDRTILIVSNMPDVRMADFREFISRILGHKYFEVHPSHQPRSFHTRYADVPTCLCVWRALTYISFEGNRLSSSSMASLVPLQTLDTLRPIPTHKKRAETGTRHKRRVKLKDVPRNIGNRPAVMPAVLGTDLNDLPQAVIIERRRADNPG
jgi:hypothetical protein